MPPTKREHPGLRISAPQATSLYSWTPANSLSPSPRLPVLTLVSSTWKGASGRVHVLQLKGAGLGHLCCYVFPYGLYLKNIRASPSLFLIKEAHGPSSYLVKVKGKAHHSGVCHTALTMPRGACKHSTRTHH